MALALLSGHFVFGELQPPCGKELALRGSANRTPCQMDRIPRPLSKNIEGKLPLSEAQREAFRLLHDQREFAFYGGTSDDILATSLALAEFTTKMFFGTSPFGTSPFGKPEAKWVTALKAQIAFARYVETRRLFDFFASRNRDKAERFFGQRKRLKTGTLVAARRWLEFSEIHFKEVSCRQTEIECRALEILPGTENELAVAAARVESHGAKMIYEPDFLCDEAGSSYSEFKRLNPGDRTMLQLSPDPIFEHEFYRLEKRSVRGSFEYLCLDKTGTPDIAHRRHRNRPTSISPSAVASLDARAKFLRAIYVPVR